MFDTFSAADKFEDVKKVSDAKFVKKCNQKRTEGKSKEQNRILQLAFKARDKMPRDYETFQQVAAHLVRNAHHYYKSDESMQSQPKMETIKEKVKCEEVMGEEIKIENVKTEMKTELDTKCTDSIIRNNNECPAMKCKDINKVLREIKTLKRQYRILEQQELFMKLKQSVGSYRAISADSGIPLKTLHSWCSVPKERKNKATYKANLRREEFVNFLMQDTISFTNPCKRYSGKRFMLHSWDEVRCRYLNQSKYHQNGIISMTIMWTYKPKYFVLAGKTPLNQCLCDYCENCQLLLRALTAVGFKGIPANKYTAVNQTLCTARNPQFGTSYHFAHHSCITRQCDSCGSKQLKAIIDDLNEDILKSNKSM